MTKGKSRPGRAILQISKVLWHLDIFRRSFRDLSGHACMVDSCIFCALKELFSQLQFSNETALPPDALRRALAESFYDQQRFQLGFMDDAAECFENMLLRIHMHIAKGEAEDMCNARHCIPHQKFAMTLVEQSVCSACGASSEPLPFTQMVHYVSASALTAQAHQVISGSTQIPVDLFGKLLRRAGGMGDIRDCPSTCGAKIQIRRSLMNRPEIVSVGIVWDSERPTLEHIMDVFAAIGTSLRLADVFYSVVDNKWGDITLHNLVGVVTYYGKHYSTFFFHSKLRVWIYFDDATVREVGPRWDQVVDKCRRGRYQPLLLLYAVPNGTPVNTENAPKQITPFHSDEILKSTNTLARRSVTPSPEKPVVGNTRRAITPNPDGSFSQNHHLPCLYNEYQNLSIIQDKIHASLQLEGTDTVDGDVEREPEYISRKCIDSNMFVQQHTKSQLHRTLSNGSSSAMEGICVPEHLNVPRRRDSGNWSGDRNSASSSSSTTMENPYSYLVGKLPHSNNGSVPSSPTKGKSDSSSASSGVYDAGYDSYSLSSNDSSAMVTVQHLMKQGHLAKIPEDYGNSPNQQLGVSCDILCDEADKLLGKSRQLEDEHDLVLALALCNAAATKARAAMNAPYNNPQTLTLARMKHNTCIMRARSLHRRITQTQNPSTKESHPEIRHTREGSSGSGRHSRQGSRDKGQHSRQNSKELLVVPPVQEKPTLQTKSIEIYATLPKKRGLLKSKAIDFDEDKDYVLYDKPARESRGLLSRIKFKDESKIKEKRSRSEDRNKISRDFSLAPSNLFSSAKDKDMLKRESKADDHEDRKEKDKSGKKQHKIRRKLLMGGLIRRKNRSMPDLTKGSDESKTKNSPSVSVDDSNVGVKNSKNNLPSICGYLSEGHLEFSGTTTNPNLERSRLMRKSFHGSAGKVLTVAKVPPPPPLRTTSQLTNKQNEDEICEVGDNHDNFQSNGNTTTIEVSNPPSHITMHSCSESNYQNISNYLHQYQETQFLPINTVITQADVHQEQSPVTHLLHHRIHSNSNSIALDDGVDVVDFVPPVSSRPQLDLPPYPSPSGSVIHSRQGSTEFPLPPPPLDLTAMEEYLTNSQSVTPSPPPPESLLAQVQLKRLEILPNTNSHKQNIDDNWLRELQAKQEAIRVKKGYTEVTTQTNNMHRMGQVRKLSVDSLKNEQSKITSVKDLASKFESIKPNSIALQSLSGTKSYSVLPYPSPAIQNELHTSHNLGAICASVTNFDVLSKKRDDQNVSPIQIESEINEVKRINEVVHKTLNSHNYQEVIKRNKPIKKKSVSFCDQVILVATADEQEEDAYIPNPILERVLRNAFTKSDEGIQIDVSSEANYNTQQSNQNYSDVDTLDGRIASNTHLVQQAMNGSVYVKRNSVENLLSTNNNSVNIKKGTENVNYSNQVDGNMIQQLHRPLSTNDHYKIQSCNQFGTSFHNRSLYGTQHVEFQCTHEPRENYYGSRPLQNLSQVRQSPASVYQQMVNSNSPNLQKSANSQQMYFQDMQSVHSNSPAIDPHQQITNNSYINLNKAQYYQKISSYPSHKQISTNEENAAARSVYHKISNGEESSKLYLPCRVPDHINGELIQYQNGQQVERNYSPYKMMKNVNQSTIERNRINEELIHRQSPSYNVLPYKHVLLSKQNLQKKTVSFEVGTKGGTESPTPKAVVTPIIVNPINKNNNASVKTKCNLCRKKYVNASNSYCTDCEFYMSRFKPKS